ncbi:MAG: DUF928 domain-containing protein [Symploca sp. SIO2E9]|nr:DUF928 domain-containing protein [Symploca sp. SIO2E9]
MAGTKSQSRSKLKLLLATVSVLSSTFSYLSPVLAEPEQKVTSSYNTSSYKQIQIHFIPANSDLPNRGTPPAKHGTGSRGDCSYNQEFPPLTSLTGGRNLQLTLNEHPTFWFYVPYSSEHATSGQFSLQDQDGENDIYRVDVQPPPQPGIVSISLPSTETSLEVDKTYRWNLEINCHTSDSSEPTAAAVTGIVKRISPSGELQQQLNAAKTPIERITVYARHHIWHETLNELAQLRLRKPQASTLENAWVELLKDEHVGLENIANEPIIGTLENSSQ